MAYISRYFSFSSVAFEQVLKEEGKHLVPMTGQDDRVKDEGGRVVGKLEGEVERLRALFAWVVFRLSMMMH